MKVIYYSDELNDDFGKTLAERDFIPDNYEFIQKNLFQKFMSFVLYHFVAKVVFFFYFLFRGIKVKGRKNLKKVKGNYFLYGNHTIIEDAFITQTLINRRKRTYILTTPNVINTKGLRFITKMLGVLPVGNTISSQKKLNEAINYYYNKGKCIVIYPEAHLWPYCTFIRNFKSSSFRYAARLNSPVFAICTTFKETKKKPKITIHVSEPIYCQKDLTEKENMNFLRNEVFNFLDSCAKKYSNSEYAKYVKKE